MTKLPGQFSIVGLLMLITAVAALCAVLRLPLHGIVKVLVVYGAIVLYYHWAVAPRTKPPWKHIIPSVLGTGSQLPLLLWMIFQPGPPRSFFSNCFFGILLLFMLLVIAFSAWHSLKMGRALDEIHKIHKPRT